MKLHKSIFLFALCFVLFSCEKENENNDLGAPESVDRFDYTEEEKEEELSFIQQYVLDNDINATQSESGLFYQITEQGFGIIPDTTDTFIAHFEVYNAKTGDTLGISSKEENPYGTIIELDNIVKGVEEGLLLTREGTTIRMVVPSFLGFGKIGDPRRKIEPKAILDYTFEVTIVLKNG